MESPDAHHCPTCGADLAGPGETCPTCMATRSSADVPLAPRFAGPRQIAGYRILRELGAGGMGTVFEAHDEKMDRKVALKVMSRHHAPSAKADRRFEQEAWIAGKLDHPNLVKVYERGEWEELSYYSMELVDGGSLADVVQNMKRWGRDDRLGLSFDTREYVAWAIEQIIAAARGLDYAHRKGVVHRDIKPMNLLLNSELGAVQIADFGLAIDEEATRLTTVGKVLGTLAYMAPEQMLGHSGEIGPASDIYALGVTLFELLTLELPYTGNTQQLYMDAVLTVEARRPSRINEQVGRDLETVIRKALEKNPRDRYATAAAFASDLENVLRLRPIEAQAPSRVDRLVKWIRRKPIHAALLGTLIVSVPTIGVLTFRWSQQHRALTAARVGELWDELRWLSRNQQYAEVIERANELLELDSGHWQARRARAVARRFLARPDDGAVDPTLAAGALADADAVIAARPGRSWPYELKAHILDRLGRPAEEVRAMAEQYRDDSPGDDELLFGAYLARDQGDNARAVELLTELQERLPGDPLVVTHRAAALEDLGRTDEAIADFRLAMGLAPGNTLNRIDLGRALTRAGRLEEGQRHLEKALEHGDRDALAKEWLAYNLYLQGMDAIGKVGPDAALALFERAASVGRESLALDPELAWARVNLAATLLETNRLLPESDPALLREATALYAAMDDEPEPDSDESEAWLTARINYCDALIQLGELQRALDVCSGIVAVTPDDPVAHYNLAGVHALSGNTREALTALRRDLELGDTDWQYLAEDRWFESLHPDPEFQRILTEMRRRAE